MDDCFESGRKLGYYATNDLNAYSEHEGKFLVATNYHNLIETSRHGYHSRAGQRPVQDGKPEGDNQGGVP